VTVTTEASTRAQRMDNHPGRSFVTGLVASTVVVLATCGLILPRFSELSDLGDGLLQVAGIVAAAGIALCAVSRWRALGAGVVAGVAVGLLLAWSGLVLYIGLFQV